MEGACDNCGAENVELTVGTFFGTDIVVCLDCEYALRQEEQEVLARAWK